MSTPREHDAAILKLQEPLLAAAASARNFAYAPYSLFAVGAAALTVDGRIYSGCNMENASYGLTLCAERNAIAAAVAAGMRRGGLAALAVEGAAVPCGACLQVIAEFGGAATVIFTQDRDSTRRVFTLDELLPQRFALLNR